MTLERRIWLVARLSVLLLFILSTRIVYWQLVRGDDLQPLALDPGELSALSSLPQPVVQRTVDFLEDVQRGSIYDRNGRMLASDRQNEEGERIRFYTEPSLAHVIGYTTGLGTGAAGLELSYNETLLGLDRIDTPVSRLLHRSIQGSDLILTIDSQTQRAAEAALRGVTGAIVVLDGDSGAVLAMASAPRFDPNRIQEPGYLAELAGACAGIPNCQGGLLNRAAQGLFTPGSTWKTVSLIAALDSGQVTRETVFDFGDPLQGPNGPYYVYYVDGGVVPDFNHRERQLDLAGSYAKSANAAFARIGDEMPPDVIEAYARRFGFGAPGEIYFPLEIDAAAAQLAQNPNQLYSNNLLRAVTAIGQGELLASPLHMGMVALAVLNEGDLPLPYFVHSVRYPSGRLIERLPNRQVMDDLMRPETARTVRDMLENNVTSGSGQLARVPGLVVGGKTGTAELGGGQDPHAWFLGFAASEQRSVVIVVMVEHGGEGSRVAAPLFAQVASVALDQQPEQVVEEIVPTPLPPPTPTPAPTPEPLLPEILPGLEGEEQPEEPAPTTIPGVPPPDIPRDPDKRDITAESASCPAPRDPLVGTGEFRWPSQYQALSGTDFMEGHPGIDLSAPRGTPVYAADSGLVLFSGWSGLGYGNAILIDHMNGFQTLYAHLSQISIPCGARVERGKLIGMSGNTGNSTGPHLHFEVRVPGGYLNPLKVLPLP